ncbi:MAG: DUF72 domain-containing protein [Bacteroidota bacterium]
MNANLIGNFYCGISGLQLPIPKYLYPPEHQTSSRLTYYSSFFNSIEINSTFYRLPMISTIGKWNTQVPENFKFTCKLWKDITHVKDLAFKEKDVEQFFKVIAGAGYKKGCLLVQFPPSLGKINHMQLDALLRCIQQNNSNHDWKIAVEFRHRSWYDSAICELLDSYKAGLVIQDIPKSYTPMISHVSDFIYLRFHGPTGNYRESYSESFLSEYATYIREWLEEGKVVYAYFNNTMGDAFKNAETLNQLMSQMIE